MIFFSFACFFYQKTREVQKRLALATSLRTHLFLFIVQFLFAVFVSHAYMYITAVIHFSICSKFIRSRN